MTVRVPSGVRKQIDALIERGLYLNLSDFLRSAIRNELVKAQNKQKLDETNEVTSEKKRGNRND